VIPEFWRDEAARARDEWRYLIVRWTIAFVLVFGFVVYAVWWAGQTVRFGASRVEGVTAATYRVYGIVRDSASGEPVPFAKVQDDPRGRPPHYETLADHLGHFELVTVAEPRKLLVSALGYRPRLADIGRKWYAWQPADTQRVELELQKE
jgi:hypothetical protein